VKMSFQKRLVQLDVDSTFIEQEAIELLAAKAGVLDEVARITDAAMRGELDFAQSLIARVALLRGLGEDAIGQVQKEIRLTDGAAELVALLHEKGHCVSLVSGGFNNILQSIVDELKIGCSVDLINTVAIGDGANDLDMMQIAGISIAFNAKPIVEAAADYSIKEPSLRSVPSLINL